MQEKVEAYFSSSARQLAREHRELSLKEKNMKNTKAPIFTWLTGYHDKLSGERQGVQEAADGSLRAYVLRPNGEVEVGRCWFKSRGGPSLQVRAS